MTTLENKVTDIKQLDDVLRERLDALCEKLTEAERERYDNWIIDDAGCNLVAFMEDEWFDNRAGLDTLCWAIEGVLDMKYELKELRKLADIGRATQTLINQFRADTC
ncbi:MAG: hypothetical protein AAFY26_25915 [Cyanobacteria bacterium J06638_22]